MRCKICGKNHADDALVCDNCGQSFDGRTKVNTKKDIYVNNISLLLLMGLIHALGGLVLLALAIKGGLPYLIGAFASFLNAAIFISIDSRLSRLEEVNRINEEKFKKNVYEKS
jgi:hypothetical protein